MAEAKEEQQQYQHLQQQEDQEIFTKLFTPAEQTLIKYNYLRNSDVEMECKHLPFIENFEQHNLDSVVVLHDSKTKPT